MKKNPISQWCSDATQLIKFPPDRIAVREELKQHLLDKQEDLRQQGVPEEEIEARSVAAMGSAEEIAPQLAAIHRPFWGYAYRVCCVILTLVFLVSLHFLVLKIWGMPSATPPSLAEPLDHGTVYHLSEPNTCWTAGEYSFKAVEARIHAERYENIPEELLYLSVVIRVQHPKFYNSANLMQYIWAEDDQGNRYYSSVANCYLPDVSLDQYIRPSNVGGWLYKYHILTLWGFASVDAKWIDLHYDRDGTQFTVRIDLTGGAAQ